MADGKRLDPPPGYNYWNPDLGRADVAQYAAAVASHYFDAHPNAVSFSLGVNDGLVFGESPETLRLIEPQRWFRDRPDYSRLVFTFMNRAASELAKTHPDKYLGCLAYYWCENAPDFPVDPHVIPFLTADRAQSYDPGFMKQEFDLQNRWARALGIRSRPTEHTDHTEIAEVTQSVKPTKHAKDTKLDRPGLQGGTEIAERTARSNAGDPNREMPPADREPSTVSREPSAQRSVSQLSTFNSHPAQTRLQPRLGLYDYLDDYGFLVPRVPIHAFAAHIRHAYEVGFTDYFGESERNWGLDGPMPWVIAQLLQDPEQDVDRLLDVYYENYFGPAVGPMRAFFDLCEQQWMRQTGRSYWLKYYRNQSQAKLFPPEVCRKLRWLLNRAAVIADHEQAKQKVFSSPHPDLSPVEPDSDLIRQRVAFVSDAFAVTERFVAFQYAREALARATLASTVTASQLEAYLNARHAFIQHSHEIAHRRPLAIYPISYDDWLSDDPAFAAAYELARTRTYSRSETVYRTKNEISQPPTVMRETLVGESSAWPSVATGVAAAKAVEAGDSREILPNGSLEGPLQCGRRIAGLQYAIDLPAPWQSKVEPMHHHFAIVWQPAERSGSQGLRISGAESTAAYVWLRANPGKVYAASMMVRGTVAPTTMVMLTVSWLDANQQRIGDVKAMRLPEGTWPNWIELRQGGAAPMNAVWIGIGIRVQHQGPREWIEADDFSLRERN